MSDDDSDVLAVLPGSPATASEIAAELGWRTRRAVRALNRLRDLGSVSREVRVRNQGSVNYTMPTAYWTAA